MKMPFYWAMPTLNEDEYGKYYVTLRIETLTTKKTETENVLWGFRMGETNNATEEEISSYFDIDDIDDTDNELLETVIGEILVEDPKELLKEDTTWNIVYKNNVSEFRKIVDSKGLLKKYSNWNIFYKNNVSKPTYPDQLPQNVARALEAACGLAAIINSTIIKKFKTIQVSPAAFKTFMKNYISQLKDAVTRVKKDEGKRVLRGRSRNSFLDTAATFSAEKVAELERLERAHITRKLRDQHTQNVLLATLPKAELEQQMAEQGKSIADFEREQIGKSFSNGDGGAIYALLCAMDLLNEIFREARGSRSDFPYDQFLTIGPNDPDPELPSEQLSKKGYVFLRDAPPNRDFVYSVYEETVFEQLGLPTTGPKGRALLKYIDNEICNIRNGEAKNASELQTVSLFNFKSSNDDLENPPPNDTSKTDPQSNQKGKRKYKKRQGKTIWQFWQVNMCLYAEGARFSGTNKLDYSQYARSVYASIIDCEFQHKNAGKIASAAFYIDNRIRMMIDHLRALPHDKRIVECPDGIASISGRVSDLPLPKRRNDRNKYIGALKKALAEGAGIKYEEEKKDGNVWYYKASKVVDRITRGEPEIITT